MPIQAGYTIENIVSIKALDTSVLVEGYARLSRTPRQWYSYSPSSIATANDTTILQPTSGVGRWFILEGADISGQIVNSTTIQKNTPLSFSVILNSLGDTHISALSQSKITGLITALAGKANSSHTHVSTDITNFTESVQDIVGAFITDSTTIDVTYDDTANTFTLVIQPSSITDTQISAISQAKITGLITALGAKADSSHTHVSTDITDFAERTQDVVGALLAPGTNITLDYDDASNTLVINSTGGGGSGGIAGVTVKDESTTVGTDITSLNFIGTGVSVASVGVQSNITINSTLNWDGIDKTTWDALQ